MVPNKKYVPNSQLDYWELTVTVGVIYLFLITLTHFSMLTTCVKQENQSLCDKKHRVKTYSAFKIQFLSYITNIVCMAICAHVLQIIHVLFHRNTNRFIRIRYSIKRTLQGDCFPAYNSYDRYIQQRSSVFSIVIRVEKVIRFQHSHTG